MELENGLTKGVDKFESGVAKARDKIDSIGEQTKEQYQNWKRVLSGALNDKQLIIALTILFGFYLFFSGFNTILGGNARDENTVTCACPVGHSAYYRTLLNVTVVAWVVCFVLTSIWDTVKFWRYAIGKRSSLRHHTSSDIEDARDHASSMLEKTISSVEAGAQAARKIPVKSIFTKAMGIVDDTLDMVDEGAEALHKIDSGLKEVTEKPLESILNKSMEIVDGVVTHRLESTDKNTASKSKASESAKLSSTTESLLQKATEIVHIAKQDPTLAKVANPLDEKAQEIKHSTVGSMLTKSVELVEDGMQTINQNPAELMVSKAMDFVDDKAQINSAELIAKSKELVDQVNENPTDSLLAGSMNVIGNTVGNGNVEGQNVMQLVYPHGHNSEAMHDAASMSTSSMLSAATGMVNTGLQVVKQDPDVLVLSKAMEFAEDKVAHSNPLMPKTVGLVTTAASSENPAESLLQGTMKMAKQDPTVSETMTSLNNGSLAFGGSLLSAATGMVDNRTQAMEQIPENSVFTNAIGFVEGDDDVNQVLSKSAGLATNVLSNQGSAESQTAVQNNAKSVLTDAAKSVTFGKSKVKKSRSKKSLPAARQLSEADTNALLRLKHYEDYLWLQFYKVYSVGATLEGEDQVLPAFINVIGGDHKESDGYETSADDEIKPLIEENRQKTPEIELIEVQNLNDDVDADDIPAIVIEPDFSDENQETEENYAADEVPTIVIESNMSSEIPDVTSDRYDTENSDLTAVKNDDQTTNHDDINLRALNQDGIDSAPDLVPVKDHPLAQAKLTQSNTSLLSVKTNSTQPRSANSTTSLLSIKSNTTDEDEDLLGSWIYLKPVGLYNDSVDEENVVMVVADATCARVSFFLYPLLVLTRLLSQLVLVPLLLFQILDTYAWICITGDVYCSSILNQYRLGLDKAALAFTFYCCLLASILATAILRWFPCSKYARKAGATCIM